ncbi:helix-turn-helix domain-containing protein [Haloferax marisrubri]|uniref:Helix-turn-helix domain-containing protein n=1 Tax=Haloferax marisrubri TaxID=1544719 RepID=A0A2P4NSS4_9EURY|nr:helix-turn-helix domain-containing protein [Haloferax marisrubri]POG56207.1 helix-turn-helix domain-containing protein [Haloferax marisrubri]
MAIVAEILLSSDVLPLVKLARSLPSREISLSQMIRLEDSKYIFMVSVEADARDAFEAKAVEQPEVVDVRPVGETPDGWFYQVITERASDVLESHDPTQFEGVLMEAIITGEGWIERKMFADYDALSTLRDRCQVYGLPFELLNISSDPEHPDERAQFGLTDRQYEAMRLAFSLGYYDTPRTASTAEVAAELGISAPALSDLLRRAEHRLISQTIANGHILNPIASR